MIAGVKAAIKIDQTSAMQAYSSRLINDTLPGCENYNYDSHAYWECAIRTVIDIQGLRVANAFIMSEIISAH
ncbi:hypothetical protein ACFW04_009725 [Cataglyphis niger]